MKVLHVGLGFRPLRWGGLIAYAEDLMDAQVARGHEVAWFCCGRSYPFMQGPRLRRWKRRGIAMYEVLNTPVVMGGDLGPAYPERELDEPATEAMFRRTLDEFRPDVVHVQELLGLPSSLFGIARERGVPVLMTLEDYQPLCPTLKLYDAEGNICLRRQPGSMCAVCCRDAPLTNQNLIEQSLRHDEQWVLEKVPGLKHVPRPRPLVNAVRGAQQGVQRAWRRRRGIPDAVPEEPVSTAAPPEAYDRRRDVNVARLSEVDLLIAMSNRVAEIYAQLGVDASRIRVLHLTLDHIANLRPRRIESVGRPVRFATLAGCASAEKGSFLVRDTVRLLREQGFTERDYRLTIKGYLDDRVEGDLRADPAVELGTVYGPEHMDEMLDALDVGIVPSMWEEAYGYVGVEFLAKGLPVIGNAVGGITDYVREGETGWLNDRTPEGMAAIMASIIRDPGQVAERNARILELRGDLVKSLPQHVDEMESVYAELTGRASAAAP